MYNRAEDYADLKKERRRFEAMATIKRSPILTQIYEIEEEAMNRIMALAIACQNPRRRWSVYSLLKDDVVRIVGFKSRYHVLGTQEHYQAMMHFVDHLLVEIEDAVLARMEDDYCQGVSI